VISAKDLSMTTENLVTIDFDSEIVDNNDIDEQPKPRTNQEIDLTPEVSYSDHNNLDDSETILNESQPLLGGDHHDHITYNQFPGKTKTISFWEFSFPSSQFIVPSS
jgi:hypothetical protein